MPITKTKSPTASKKKSPKGTAKNAKASKPTTMIKGKTAKELGAAANAAIGETTVGMIPMSSIRVREGYNARKVMDEEKLDTLAYSFGKAGLAQPIGLIPDGESGYFIVGGERRYRAAVRALVEVVPAIIFVDEDQARRASFAENFYRVDLNPMETAEGLRDLAADLGLATNRKIAAEVKESEARVSEHLALLKLPEALRPYFADGTMPVDAERLLRPIAEVSPQVAEGVCLVAKRDERTHTYIRQSFDRLLEETARSATKFEPAFPMVPTRGLQLSDVVGGEKLEELTDRLRAILPRESAPWIYLDTDEVDAARAAHCLIEETNDPGYGMQQSWITDPALAADLIERRVERMEAAAKEADERKAAERQEKKEKKEKSPQAKAKEAAEVARRHNEEVGRRISTGKSAAENKARCLARTKALVLEALNSDADLAARGLRLVLPQLRTLESKTLKSGKRREWVVFLEPHEAEKYLRERVMKARTAGEAVEVWAQARTAALLADEKELPKKERVHWYRSDEGGISELLAADLKAFAPRQKRANQS